MTFIVVLKYNEPLNLEGAYHAKVLIFVLWLVITL